MAIEGHMTMIMEQRRYSNDDESHHKSSDFIMT